jgi:hypothetical protein
VKAGEGRVRIEKFGFVLFKAVKAESGKTGLH